MTTEFKKEQIIFYSIEDESLKKLHIYESGVSAGFPSPADDYLDVDLNLHKYLVKHPAATFFIIAKGHSMERAGISDSDLLVVDKSLEPKNKDIVVAIVDGEFTVKRIKIESKKVYLIPENKKYSPIEINEENELIIWGIVTYVIKKL